MFDDDDFSEVADLVTTWFSRGDFVDYLHLPDTCQTFMKNQKLFMVFTEDTWISDFKSAFVTIDDCYFKKGCLLVFKLQRDVKRAPHLKHRTILGSFSIA